MRVRTLESCLTICLIIMASLSMVQAEQTGNTIKIALGKEPDTLNPIFDTGHGDFYDIIKIFSGLVKSDESLQMAPDLAESWEISPDGKVYTFKLRDGVKWHDGVNFSVEDVVFTYNLLREGKWTSVFPVSSEYKIIEDISVEDKNKVRFTLSEGLVPFQERFALPILPKHLLEGQDLTKTDFWQHPVGTGPYVFDQWKRGEEITLKRNQDYFGDTPQSDAVKYVFVPDEAARISLLLSGEVDAIKIDPRSMDSIEGRNGIKIYSVPSANWYAINLPNNMWPFDSKKVRQAIARAINKQQILETIFNGQGEIAYGPFRSADWVYNPKIAFKYDPELSKRMLAEEGFSDVDGDRILEKDGKDFEFELIYPSTNPERKDIAIAVKSDLANIGIKVEPVGKSWDEISPELYRSNPIVAAFGSPFDPDDNNYQLWSSKYIGVGWWNPASYSNETVDELLERGRTTFDREKRKVIYGEIQEIISDDQPLTFIVFCNYVYAVNDRIAGIKPRNAPHGEGTNGGITGELWWNVEEWQKE